MASKRYTILIADRDTGVVRRFTFPVRPAGVAAAVVLLTPILIGLGAAWKGRADVAALYESHEVLELENTNYRAATDALAGQIASLQTAIETLGERSALDPALARAMERLPNPVKSRAMGGAPSNSPLAQQSAARALAALATPEDTFGLLRSVLEGLQSRLSLVALNVDRRNALAAATPSMWPSYGWLTSRMGTRRDPMTGSADYHSGVDIAGQRGQAVYATADGTVRSVGYQGAYGNLIVIDHGFGLETRYGHLLKTSVAPGSKVQRGDIIGQVGSTGRSTGYHLHYEVLANGRLLNPLQLLTQRPRAQ
jgi:murein DD-endopeptidase MepM/ murein hydrolase activator NlpD